MNIALIEHDAILQTEYCARIKERHQGSTIYCYADAETAVKSAKRTGADLILTGSSIAETEISELVSYINEQRLNAKIEQCAQYFQK